jgi:hypothetical protein
LVLGSMFALGPAFAQDAGEDLAAAMLGAAAAVLQNGDGSDSGDLGSTPSTVDESAASATAAPAPSGAYSSVCMRNGEKYENEVPRQATAEGAEHHNEAALATPLHEARKGIYAPCAASDPNAQAQLDRSQKEIDDVAAACANGQGNQCDGIEDPAAQRWLDLALAEANRATSDPNYSADYGPVDATGQAGGGQLQQKTVDEMACLAELDKVAARLDAVNRKHLKEVVTLSEALMWATGKSMKIVKTKCPQTLVFKEKYKEFKKTRSAAERTCNQVATRTCEARLPAG